MASQKGKTQNYRLIFVGDEIWHQEQYETWLPFIKRLEQEYPAFTCSKISDRFVSDEIYAQQDKMKRLELFLLNPEGEVVWSVTGDWSPIKAESLDDELIKLTELFDDFY
ncbi:MAG: hypothetical protein AB8G95_10740 [Anaerolineae bacterium]